MREAEWSQQVLELAQLYNWLAYHTFDSRHSEKGFPDLVLVRERVVFIELKTDSRGSKLTYAQSYWLKTLSEAGAETHVFRPSDFEALLEVLK